MVRPDNCQNCGSPLLPTAKFCLECGTKVELVPADAAGAGARPVEATYQQQAAAAPSSAGATAAGPLPTALDVAMQRAETTAPGASAPPPAPPAEPVTAPTSTAAPSYDAAGAAETAAPSIAPPSAPATSVPPAAPAAQPAPAAGGGPRLIGPDGATLALPPGNELVVGREDPVSGIHPDVDLTPHGGEAGGVSRRHAVLRQQGGQWSVTDLDSTNYTRLEGRQLQPHVETPVQDGARIQFGRIEFVFHAQ